MSVDPLHNDLNVTLTLFGFAGDWLAAAVEAMTAALVHDVDWRGQTGFSCRASTSLGAISLKVRGSRHRRRQKSFILEFLSPLVLTGVDPRERPMSLVTGLGQRLEGLARWP